MATGAAVLERPDGPEFVAADEAEILLTTSDGGQDSIVTRPRLELLDDVSEQLDEESAEHAEEEPASVDVRQIGTTALRGVAYAAPIAAASAALLVPALYEAQGLVEDGRFRDVRGLGAFALSFAQQAGALGQGLLDGVDTIANTVVGAVPQVAEGLAHPSSPQVAEVGIPTAIVLALVYVGARLFQELRAEQAARRTPPQA